MRPDRASVLQTYTGESEATYWESFADSGFDTAEKRAIRRTIQQGRGLLLVVGSGTGRETFEFARLGHKVIGVDLARGLLLKAAARRKVQQSDASFIVADATHLPFRTGRFEYVSMLAQVIGHIPGQEGRRRALVEAARVIADKGRILVSVYNGSFKDYPTPYLLWRLVRRKAATTNPISASPPSSFWYSDRRVLFERVSSIARTIWRGRALRFRIAVRTVHHRLRPTRLGSPRDLYVQPSGDHVRFRPEPGLAYFHLYTRREFLDDIAASGLDVEWEASVRELNSARSLPTPLRRLDFLLYFSLRKKLTEYPIAHSEKQSSGWKS